MSRAHPTCVVLLILAVTHSAALAEEDGPQPVNTTASLSAGADEDITRRHDVFASSDRVQEHPAGTYTGVAPGATATPAVSVPAGKGPATITWPGFQMRADGSSRVFIQSTSALEPQPSAAAGKFVVLLPGARVSGGTNRLPLETRFFNTPVTRVSLAVTHDGVQLTLDLRGDVVPRVSSERGPNGYYFTYIDLPKGQFVAVVPKPKPGAVAQAAAPAADGHASGPDDLTTALDSNGPADAAAIQRAEAELPPGVKAHSRMSGNVKLGR
jgi:hypothetical protein